MSVVSKAVQSAKSVLKKIPGSESALKIFEKKTETEGELDSKSVAKLFGADRKGHRVIGNAPVQLTPEELERICDISRLKTRQHCLMHGQVPPTFDKDSEYSKSYVYQRKMFARYGASSGVDPRKIWPSEEEVEAAKRLNCLKFQMTGDELLTTAASIREEALKKEAESRALDDKIASNIIMMEKMKEKMYTDAVKVEAELDAAEEKRNKRIEKVRRHFQYTLTVKDPRFKEKMTEMIRSEKEALKAKGKASKKQQRAEQVAKLDAAKAAAIKARQEARAKKADAESSDDE